MQPLQLQQNLRLEDIQIALEIMKCSRQAEQVLYNKYRDRVEFCCKKYLKNKNHTKDVVAEVFLKVIDNLKQKKVKKPEYLSSYIYSVTKYICLNVNRKPEIISIDSNYSVMCLPNEDRTDRVTNNDDDVKMKKVLVECMEQLSDLDNNIIILFYYKKFTNKAISKECRITQTNVGVRKMRALIQLRNCIEGKRYGINDVF